ncbi:MAG: hypothetical protein R3B48_19615 [Kofleriaceae bacterium]
MTRPSNGWPAAIRRGLERHVVLNVAVLTVFGVPATVLLPKDGYLGLGIALIVVPCVLLALVHRAAPPREVRRLAARALSRLPATDGKVALRGRITTIGDPLRLPATSEVGAAYWWRCVDTSDGGQDTLDEATKATDFVVRCGDELIAVEGSHARVLFDPRSAEVIDKNDYGWREYLVAQVGDDVLLEGWLHRGDGGGPHRAMATLSTSGSRRPTIGLLGKRDATR